MAINEAVAVKVFGAEIVRSPFSKYMVVCDFPDRDLGDAYPNLPDFANNMDLAMKVRDRIKQMGFKKRHYFTERIQALITADMPGQFAEGHFIHPAEIILYVEPKHICIAALETVAYEG